MIWWVAGAALLTGMGLVGGAHWLLNTAGDEDLFSMWSDWDDEEDF